MGIFLNTGNFLLNIINNPKNKGNSTQNSTSNSNNGNLTSYNGKDLQEFFANEDLASIGVNIDIENLLILSGQDFNFAMSDFDSLEDTDDEDLSEIEDDSSTEALENCNNENINTENVASTSASSQATTATSKTDSKKTSTTTTKTETKPKPKAKEPKTVTRDGKNYRYEDTDGDGKWDVRYTVDKNGKIGDTLTYKYDKTGKKISSTLKNSSGKILKSYKFDENGKISEKTNHINGRTSFYTYDANGNKTKTTVKNKKGKEVATYNWSYDKDNNLTSCKKLDARGKVVAKFKYENGRKVSVENTKTKKISYFEYDESGKAKTKTVKDKKGNVLEVITYSYDSFGNKISSVKKDKNGKVIAKYTFNSFGQITEKQDLEKNRTHKYFYNSYGKKSSEDILYKDKTVTKKYQYDDYDNRTRTNIRTTYLETYGKSRMSGVSGNSKVGQRIVDEARRYLGINEGTNKASGNRFVKYTRGGGCDDFATYIIDKSTSKDERADWYNKLSDYQKAWTPDIRKAARKAGALVDIKDARTGDLITIRINANGKNVPHTVICKKIENGKLYTIESGGKGKIKEKIYDVSSIEVKNGKRTIMRVTK